MRDALKQFHIKSCVRDALSRHGIAHDSPLRAQLEANATIAAGESSRVRTGDFYRRSKIEYSCFRRLREARAELYELPLAAEVWNE